MPIDLTRETLISLDEAAQTFPSSRGGEHVSEDTVKRWITRGLRGIRLDGCMSGGSLVTSKQALQRFTEALLARRLGQAQAVASGATALTPQQSLNQQALAELRAADC